MATITNNVRWASNTDELKRNLLSGIDTIDAMKRSVDRVAESLGGSGLFRAANTAVASIQQLGGATKLTAAELDKQTAKIDKAIEKYEQMGRSAPTAMVALSAEMKRLSAETETTTQKMDRLSTSLTSTGNAMKSAGTALSISITAPLVALGYTAIKASIDFESAFAGVKKTVTGTPAELQQINTQFREMALVTPVSAVGLAKIGEMAGQLGVHKENIVAFTKTIVDISTATNLTADEAGSSFARLANVMKLPQDQFSNLGSAVVALGNFGASTEQEMLSMAQRISAAGAAAGFTTPQVLGIANALSSVGIEAEAGGTAISRVITKMATDVASGGGHLKQFAATAGMSAQQFSAAWKTDAGAAFSAFMEGLSHVKDKGESLFAMMDELGFKEVRLKNAMLSAAGAGDLMKDSIALGSKAFTENTELTRAAGERYQTTAKQMEILNNKFTDFKITLGDALVPVLRDLMKAAEPLVAWASSAAREFAQLPEPMRLTIIGVAGLTAALGPAVFVMGSFVGAAGQLAKVFGLLAGAEAAGGMAAMLGFLANPVVLGAALVIGGIAAAIYELNKSLDQMEHHSSAGQVLQGLKDGAGNAMLNASAAQSMSLARSGNPDASGLKDGMKLTIPGFKPKVIAGSGQSSAVPLTKAEARQAAADLESLTNATRSYAQVLNLVSNATYEGIKADLARGVSEKAVAREYGVGITVVKDVIAIEKEYVTSQKEIAKAKEEVRMATIPLTEAQKQEVIELMKLPVSMRTIAGQVGAAEIQIKVFTESLKELDRIRVIEMGRGPIISPIAGQQIVNVHEQLKAFMSDYEKIRNIETGVPLEGPIKGELRYKPSMSDIPPKIKEINIGLQAMSQAFQNIGIDSHSGLGQAIDGFMSLLRVIEQSNSALGRVKSQAGVTSSQIADATRVRNQQVAAAAIGIGTNLIAQNINTGAGASKGNLVAAGALQGAATGAALGAPFAAGTFGISIAAGAAAGAIAGWVQSGKEWRKVVNDIGRDMGGLRVSEDFAKMIDDLEDQTGLQRVQAITTQLDQLVQMAGGLNASNFDLFFGKLHDAFSYVEQGSMSVAQVTQIMDKNFAQFAAAGTDAAGRVSDKIKELIDLDRRFGTHSKEVAAWQLGQADTVVAGFNAVQAAQQDAITGYDAIKKAVDDAQSAVDALMASGTTGKPLDAAMATLAGAKTNQAAAGSMAAPELSDLGFQAVGAYEADVGAGKSKAEALQSESAALTALQKEYKDLGLEVTDVALQNLFMQNSMQTAAPTLMAGIAGVTKQMIGLDNMGLETKDSFLAQEHAGESMYTRLQAAAFALGGTTKDALLPMQDYLHQAVEEAKKLGIPLDDLTQQMVDQSKDAGVWQDNITPAPTVLSTLGDLKTIIEDIDRALRGLPPNVHTTVTTTHVDDNAPPPSDAGDNTAATGGLVGWKNIRHFANGGPVGTDTVNAWLTPGESVLTRSATDAIGYDTISAWNRGSMGFLKGDQLPGALSISGSFGGDGLIAPPPWMTPKFDPPPIFDTGLDKVGNLIEGITGQDPDGTTHISGRIGAAVGAEISASNAALMAQMQEVLQSVGAAVGVTQQATVGGGGDLHITLQMDGQVVAKTTVQHFRKNTGGVGSAAKASLGLPVTTWT